MFFKLNILNKQTILYVVIKIIKDKFTKKL